jgi:hypothetical protein
LKSAATFNPEELQSLLSSMQQTRVGSMYLEAEPETSLPGTEEKIDSCVMLLSTSCFLAARRMQPAMAQEFPDLLSAPQAKDFLSQLPAIMTDLKGLSGPLAALKPEAETAEDPVSVFIQLVSMGLQKQVEKIVAMFSARTSEQKDALTAQFETVNRLKIDKVLNEDLSVTATQTTLLEVAGNPEAGKFYQGVKVWIELHGMRSVLDAVPLEVSGEVLDE